VQSYPKLTAWKSKALPYLKKEEGWNNLFWQIIRAYEKSAQDKARAVNIFSLGRIQLSAIVTPSSFLLLSHGSRGAVHALSDYIKRKHWSLAGVSGPEDVVRQFLSLLNQKDGQKQFLFQRQFTLFQTKERFPLASLSDYQICHVGDAEWPRARIWAQQFAAEADPPMNLAAITQMAKLMHTSQNLFILKNRESNPCGMAGFGRSTDRYQVINMVYVPPDLRGQGVAKALIQGMMVQSRESGYSACLLFSEWRGERNLYDTMSCKKLGQFVEYDLV
jgi:predicted GNAT family acetyltransferase